MKFLIVFHLFFAGVFANYHSQYQQDILLHENIFKTKKNGIFVEIGAYDGVLYSNSKFFEEQLGWTGICVEPNPEHFVSLKKNRPRSLCINAAISETPGYARFQKVQSNTFFVEMLSGLLDKYDPQHLDRINREVAEFGGSIEIIDVPCLTLNSILETNNITHIDYLSIDTEGGELEILKSIDFSRFSISVIEIENNYHSPEFREFLQTKGFTLIDEKYDEIYIRNAEVESINYAYRENYKSELQNGVKNNPYFERTLTTLSGEDTDYIPKVLEAGKIFNESSRSFQLMHNGIKIETDCYYGHESHWMSQIITGLRGHHEPQEEKVFFEVLKYIPEDAVIVELGSYWGYYSLWFSHKYPLRKAYLVEPDSKRLNVGKRNFVLNNLSGNFFQYYVGKKDNDDADYSQATQIGVDEFLNEQNISHVNILHSDIQGAEYLMLLSALESIEKDKIDYFFISTHGDVVHNQCLSFLKDKNFCILAEHSNCESYSGDGLIVAKRINLYGPCKVEINKNKTP